MKEKCLKSDEVKNKNEKSNPLLILNRSNDGSSKTFFQSFSFVILFEMPKAKTHLQILLYNIAPLVE